jgi:hypothetical protein
MRRAFGKGQVSGIWRSPILVRASAASAAWACGRLDLAAMALRPLVTQYRPAMSLPKGVTRALGLAKAVTWALGLARAVPRAPGQAKAVTWALGLAKAVTRAVGLATALTRTLNR